MEDNFDYDALAPDSVFDDLMRALMDRTVIPIISETEGGIIAYVLDRDHATTITRILNENEYRYAEMMEHL